MQRVRRLDRPSLAFAISAILAASLLLYLGRGASFAWDDWWFVTDRIDWTPEVFLQPHREHLSALPILTYKLVLELGGLDSYWVLRVVLTLLAVTCAGLVFVYARRRIGGWPALLLALPFLVFGSGGIDVLWPFQIGFLGPVAFGIAAMLALDRERWLVTAGLLAGALSCSAVGVAVLIGLAVELVMRGKAWVAAAPGLAFAGWYAGFGTSDARVENLDAVPGWIFESLRGVVLALSDAPYVVAGVLGVAVGVWLFCRVASTRSPRLVALVVMALALWTITALGRAETLFEGMGPIEPRYVYPGTLFVALALVESLSGLSPTPLVRRYATALALGVLVLGAVSNTATLIQDPGFSAEVSRAATLRPPDFSTLYARSVEHYGP